MTEEDIFYLGIKTLLINSDGKVLLLLRSHPENERIELWDIPGGRIRRGENIREAMMRELHEETGLSIRNKDVKFVGATLCNCRIPIDEIDAGLILFINKCHLAENPCL